MIYAGQRIGRYGKIFKQYKIRTLRPDVPEIRDAKGNIIVKKMDDRLVPGGAMLRATKVDELPQLINIIRGDMGFIGPRPVPPHIFAGNDDVSLIRHAIRPGLLGLSIAFGHRPLSWRQKLRLDLYYLKNRSARLDFYIIMKVLCRGIKL